MVVRMNKYVSETVRMVSDSIRLTSEEACPSNQGQLPLLQAFDDQCEIDEREKHDIKLVRPREKAPISLEPTEQPFDLIASCLQGLIIDPWHAAIALRRHHRHIPELHGQLSCLIAFTRPIHRLPIRPSPTYRQNQSGLLHQTAGYRQYRCKTVPALSILPAIIGRRLTFAALSLRHMFERFPSKSCPAVPTPCVRDSYPTFLISTIPPY